MLIAFWRDGRCNDYTFEITGFWASDYEADVGEEITFYWSLAANSNYSTVWINWGDGTDNLQANNQCLSTEHTYSVEGVYTVALTIVQGNGMHYSETLATEGDLENKKVITIKNEPPYFEAYVSKNNPFEDEIITWSVQSLWDSDHDRPLLTFIYDPADGSDQITTNETFIEYSWDSAGEYPITITAIDDQGALKQDTITITVLNKPPEASFTLGADIPSTYSFSIDSIGKIPFGWAKATRGTQDAIKVVDSQGSHSKVVEITGNPDHYDPGIYRNIGTQYYGTAEYHILSTNVTEKLGYFSLMSGEDEVISVYPKNGKWKYRIDGQTEGDVSNCEDPEENEWSHVRVDFIVDKEYISEGEYFGLTSNHQFQVIIDGKVSNIYSFGEIPSINRIEIGANKDSTGKAFIDSIGLSSDPDYNIGDNFNYFKSSFFGTHDWRFDVVGKQPEHWDTEAFDAETTGDYYGTYSFETDESRKYTGTDAPAGWSQDADANCYCYVDDWAGGHHKILKLRDKNDDGETYLINSFSSKTNGTVEFFWAPNNDDIQTVWLMQSGWQGDDHGKYGVILDTYHYDYRYNYYTVVGSYAQDVWDHHKIVFDCNSHTFDWFINDELVADDALFKNYYGNPDHVENLVFGTYPGDDYYYSRFDAVGYSWDPDYNIGDNKYSPLDISIEDAGGDYREVLRFTDKDTTSGVSMEENIDPQTSGTIQWYAKTNDVNSKTWALTLMDGIETELSIMVGQGWWQYNLGDDNFINMTCLGTPQANIWYPISITFDGTSDEFTVNVNGSQCGPYDLNQEFDKISKIRLGSGIESQGSAWLDALGYSWDPMYIIDDFKKSMISYPEKSFVQFSAADSSDSESDINSLRFYWNFDDGTSSFGKYVTHEFKQSGRYNVSLAVKDDNGQVDYFSQLVLVHNTYPEVDIVAESSNITINEGDTLLLNTVSTDDITDWASLMYYWDFNSTSFSLDDDEYQSGGWRQSHLFKDDFQGSCGVKIKDPEGAYDFDYTNVIVRNVDPLVSIYDASIISNITFEVYRKSISNFANFTFDIIANDFTKLSEFLTFEGSEVNSIYSNKTEVAMTLAKNWKVIVNSTEELPSGSWFRFYIRMQFLDGQELIISSEKLYGGEYGYYEADLNPYWFDHENYHIKFPMTVNGQVFDPSVDDISFTLTHESNLIVEINGTIDTSWHYLATYSFKNDFDGTVPDGWTSSGFASEVFSDIGGHAKVLRGVDPGAGEAQCYNQFSENQEYGTIEFWMRADDANTGFSVNIKDSSHNDLFSISIIGDEFRYWDGSSHDLGKLAYDNTWYYVSISFETTNGGYEGLSQWKWKVYIDNTEYGDYSFYSNNYPRRFYIGTPNLYSVTYYVDAVGYSWDQNYEIGDNKDREFSGYYPATFSFSNEQGKSETDISFVDYYYDQGQADSECIIVDDIDNHRSVLKLKDQSAQYTYIYNYFDEYYTSGIIEFWLRTTDSSKTTHIYLREGGSNRITTRISGGNLQHYYTSWQNVRSISSDRWYHLRYVFYDNNTFDWIINEVKELDKGSFQYNMTNGINQFFLRNYDVTTYLDAFGKDSDYNYQIGENLNSTVLSYEDNGIRYKVNIYEQDGIKYADIIAIQQVASEFFNENNFPVSLDLDYTINPIVDLYDILEINMNISQLSIFKCLEAKNYLYATAKDDDGGENELIIIFHTDDGVEFDNLSPRIDSLIPSNASIFHEINFFVQISDFDQTSDVQENYITSFKGEDVPSINVTSGALDEPYGDLYLQDDSYYSFATSKSYIPSSGDFTIINGTLDSAGDYNSIDSNYATFTSSIPQEGDQNHYPATYSFENDDDNTVPDDWTSYGDFDAKVYSGIDGHDKVIRALDTGTGDIECYNDFAFYDYGTIEFWMRVDDAYVGLNVIIKDESHNDCFAIGIRYDKFVYWDGSEKNVGKSASDDTWYHIRIDFEKTGGGYQGLSPWKWHVYIDETYYGDYQVVDHPRRFYFATLYWDTVTGYIDAVGYSWDENYEIGDNKDPAGGDIHAELNFTTEIQFENPLEGTLDDFELYYSYYTNITQSVNFSIYNYNLDQWDLIDTSNYDSFSSHTYTLNNSYYNANNEVLLNFQSTNMAFNRFKLYLDMLKVKLAVDSLNFTAQFHLDGIEEKEILKYLKLFYAYKTDTPQEVNISLYNFHSESWTLIDSKLITSQWYKHYYALLSTDYVNSTYDLLVKIEALNNTNNFQFFLDQLKIEYFSAIVIDYNYFEHEDEAYRTDVIEGSFTSDGNLLYQDDDYATFNSAPPVSGYYPATYSFQNDVDGTLPEGWTNLGMTCNVYSGIGGHDKVLRGVDTGGGEVQCYQHFGVHEYGTIEFWMMADDAYAGMNVMIKDEVNNDCFAIGIRYDKFTYWDGSGHDVAGAPIPQDNTWYHIRVDFEATAGVYQGLAAWKWRVYINDTLYGDYSMVDHPRRFFINTANTGSVTCFVDAVGYSWDENYEIGDNKDEFPGGLELSSSLYPDGVRPEDQLESLELKYAFKTNMSQQIDVKLYNYTSQDWITINDDVINTDFYNHTYLITSSDLYSAYYDVKLRFEGTNISQFEFDLDMLKLKYSWYKSSQNYTYIEEPDIIMDKGTMDIQGELIIFTSENLSIDSISYFDLEACHIGDDIDLLKLYYSYKSNISQIIEMSLYNYTSGKWVLIDQSSYSEFCNKTYDIPIVRYEQVGNETTAIHDFYDLNFNIKVKINATNASNEFSISIDTLKIEYEFTPHYFISNTTGDSDLLDGEYVNFDSSYPDPDNYPGTYTFEDDVIGTVPNGWYDLSGPGCHAVVQDGYGRSKTLELSDMDSVSDAHGFTNFTGQQNGTIEFWVLYAINLGRRVVIDLSDDDVGMAVYIRFETDGWLYYVDSSEVYHQIQQYSLNTWYRFRITFDCSQNWDLWIDGIQKVNGGDFYTTPSAIDKLSFYTIENWWTYGLYVDAVGFSWDESYNIGDNLYPAAVINETFTLDLQEMNNHRLGLFDTCKFTYSLNTSNTQIVKINAYNFINNSWVEFDSFISNNGGLITRSCLIRSTEFINEEDFEVKIQILAINQSIEEFDLNLDQLDAIYNWSKVRSSFGQSSNYRDYQYYEQRSNQYIYWYNGSYSFDYEGEYLIKSAADDGYFTTKTGEVIEIINSDPFAKIGNFPDDAVEDEIVWFTSDIISYGAFANESRFMWNWGDGYYSYEQNPSHAWSESGFYNISLLVVDCFGNINIDLRNITITEQPPKIMGPFTFYGVEGQAITLDVDVYDSHIDEFTLQYYWYDELNNLIADYEKPAIIRDDGEYTYRLKVEDDNSLIREAYISIIVENIAPMVFVSNYMYYGAPGGELNLTAYAYDTHYDMSDMNFYWNISSGNYHHSEQVTGLDTSCTLDFYLYNTTVFTGEVKVEDPSGKMGIGTFTISSFIDSDYDGISDEFMQRLLENNENLTSYTDTDNDFLTDVFEIGTSNTSHLNPDTDGDGLWDGRNNETGIGELMLGTDPRDWDTDNDWLSDSFEYFGWNISTEFLGAIHVSSDPCVADTDGDGLDDYEEYMKGTHPRLEDSDNDGLKDGEDPHPLKIDGDEDGLSDYQEIQIGTNPNATDTDQDGLTDGEEVLGWGFITNPLLADSDHDFLADSAEIMTYNFEIPKKKQMNQPISLLFEEHCQSPIAAQLAFSFTFGEYAKNETLDIDYGIEEVPDLEIVITHAQQDIMLFNITTNGTAQRYVSHVVDLKDAIEKLNSTGVKVNPINFDYYGDYIIRINDTEAGCLLEQYEIEIAIYLDPNNPDTDGDGIMDGVEVSTLVSGTDKIDFKDSYWVDGSNIKFEYGQVSMYQTIDKGFAAEIVFVNTYDNPVAIPYIMTRKDGQSLDVRVKNLTSTGCTIFMEEPDNYFVYYLPVQPDNFVVYDGTSYWLGDLNSIDDSYTVIYDGNDYYLYTPTQPADFTVYDGTSDWAGDLCIIDGSFTTFIGESSLQVGTLRPNGDLITNWNEGVGTPHWSHLDEINPDGTSIASIKGEDAALLVFEVGSWYLDNTIDGGHTRAITFQNTYENPIIIGYMWERGGSQSVEIRVKDVTSTGCTIFSEENDDETHNDEDFGYIVMEKGAYTLPDGTLIEAGTVSTNSNHDDGDNFGGVKVDFTQSFDSTPAVLHTLNTYNNGAFKGSIVHSVNSTSFTTQQITGKVSTSTSTEIIGWIAIEANKTGTINGTMYETGLENDGTPDGVSDSYHQIDFAQSYSSVPIIVVKQNTANDNENHSSYAKGAVANPTTTTYTRLYAEETQINDGGERNHDDESFGYWIFESSFAYKEISSIPVVFAAKFNENEGSITNDSINNLQGYLEGNTTWTTGKYDSGLFFDGDGEVAYGSGGFAFEAGEIQLTNTIDQGVKVHLNFEYTYTNPVVVAYLMSRNEDDSIEVRVDNVTSTSCDIFMEEPPSAAASPPYSSGHASEDIGYIVMEQGEWELSDGTDIKAGTVYTNKQHVKSGENTAETIYFSSQFVSNIPIILHSLNTYNNDEFKATAVKNVYSDRFDITQETAETQTSTVYETIAWIAIESGKTGTINNIKYETARGNDGNNDGSDNDGHTFTFAQSFGSAPIIITKQNTLNGGDGGWARSYGTLTSSQHISCTEEDQQQDDERSHTDEYFGFWAFESNVSYSEQSLEYSDFDYIDFGDELDYVLGTSNNEFVIAMWIYPTALTSNESDNGVKNVFFSKSGNIELGINESGYLQVYIKSIGTEAMAYYGTVNSIDTDEWTFIAIRYNNSNVDVLIGNTWYTSATGATAEPWNGGGNLVNGGNLTIGAEIASFSCFTGKLDEVSVFEKANNSIIEEYREGMLFARKERHSYGTINLGGHAVTQLKIYVYGKINSGSNVLCKAMIYVTGSSSPEMTLNFNSDWSWQTITWSSLSLSQSQLDSLEVQLNAYNIGEVYVDTIYVEVSYTQDTFLNISAVVHLNSDVAKTDDLKLFYSYKTNITQPIDFEVWNYDLEQWDLIDSANYDSFAEHSFELNTSHHDLSNDVLLRFNGTNFNAFDFQLEELKVYFEEHIIDFNVELPLDLSMDSSEIIRLYYSYKTDTTQAIDLKIWNYDLQQWDLIDSANYDSFTEHYFNLDSSYYDEDYNALLKFFGANYDYEGDFELQLEELKVYFDNEGHRNETVGYIVIEEGTWTFEDGLKIEARTIDTNSNHNSGASYGGVNVNFNQEFSTPPIVLHALNTYNNQAFKTSIAYNITSSSFILQQESAGSDTSTSTETIAWIAVEANKAGTSDGVRYETGSINDGSTHYITYSQTFASIPTAIIKQNSANDIDGSWARGYDELLSSTGHATYAEEDQTADFERNHGNEVFGFWVLEPTEKLIPDEDGETYYDYYLEIPYIGLVNNANITVKLESEKIPLGSTTVIGSVSVIIIKEEINCSIEDAVLIDNTYNIYDGWLFSEEIFVDLSDYLNDGNITEYYGSYRLIIDITNTSMAQMYYFILTEYYILTDTWVYADGLDSVNSKGWITDPAKADTDNDGWDDYKEIFVEETNPLSVDTDGDNAWDPFDRDPKRDLIIEIKFRYGRHRNLVSTDEKRPRLQGVVEFDVYSKELFFTTEAVKADRQYHDDHYEEAKFGHKYYINIEDDMRLQSNKIRFNFELWHMYPKDEDGNHLGDIKILDKSCHYYIDSEEPDYDTLEEEGPLGKDNQLKVRFTTIALEKANTIAIYEENMTFNGHYHEKERYNIIQLWVTDNNESSPFAEGPNAIIISTSLFAITKLHGLLQQERLMETPLWTPIEDDFQFISTDRDKDAESNDATNDVDFVIIRRAISSSDAMKVLDLLLTCIVNETLDETNQTVVTEVVLYTYISTKINGTKATQMNLPVGVLKFIPWLCDYEDSPQGEVPSAKGDVSINLVELILDLLGGGIGGSIAIANLVGLIIGLHPAWTEMILYITAVIVALVMFILTFLGPLLWPILRALLLILIFILLAIEIITTVPLYFAIGTSLSALIGLTGITADYYVNWWADYGEDTCIGYLAFEVFDMEVSMASYIRWNYWSFFDIWFPKPDSDFSMDDDIFESIGPYQEPEEQVQVPPSLHCGFMQVGSTSEYIFHTIYKDDNKDAPEYVNVTLISPLGNEYDYGMDIANSGYKSIEWWESQEVENWKLYISDWENYQGENFTYDENEGFDPLVWHIGVNYTVNIDFENYFSAQEREGQWFYYFKAKDDPTEGSGQDVKWPDSTYQGYYSMPGPRFGVFLSYLSSEYLMPRKPRVWQDEILNFTVRAFHHIDSTVLPEMVNVTFLLPDGSFETYEMTNISFTVFDDLGNYSYYYNKVLTQYFVSLNLSQEFNLTTDYILCYYFDALMNDGNHSILWDRIYDNSNNTIDIWFGVNDLLEVLTFSDNGAPKIVDWDLEQSKILMDNTVEEEDKWEALDVDNLIYLPMIKEQTLRFYVYVRDPDGTHQEIYDTTGKWITPELTLTRDPGLLEEEQSIKLDMEWLEYEPDGNYDIYWIDVDGSGYCSNEWTDDDTEKTNFTSGGWKIKFKVTDTENEELTDSIEPFQPMIWHMGSLKQMFKTMWGGADLTASASEDLQFTGIWKDIGVMFGYIAAAGLSRTEKLRPIARGLAILLAAGDLISRAVAMSLFFLNGDSGALIGLACNSILTIGMYYLSLALGSLRLKNPVPGASMFRSLAPIRWLAMISQGLSLVVLGMLIYTNPWMFLFFAPAILSQIQLHRGVNSKTAFTGVIFSAFWALVPFLISLIPEDKIPEQLSGISLVISFFDLFTQWDPEMPFEEWIKSVPIPILAFLGQSIALGSLLQILGVKGTDADTGKLSSDLLNCNPLSAIKVEPVQKMIYLNQDLNTIIAIVSIFAFLGKSGYYQVVTNVEDE